MRSIDHEAEDAINAYETEFGADGLRHSAMLLKHGECVPPNTRSAEPTQPKQFTLHFYVLQRIFRTRGALDTGASFILEDALNAYH